MSKVKHNPYLKVSVYIQFTFKVSIVIDSGYIITNFIIQSMNNDIIYIVTTVIRAYLKRGPWSHGDFLFFFPIVFTKIR